MGRGAVKLTLEPTAEITPIRMDGGMVHARLWTGTTADGVPVKAYIACVSPQTHDAEVNAQFGRDLRALDSNLSLHAIDIRFVS